MATESSAEAAAAARAKILEGVDFIENEEDAEAVESAVVKIQSTFRGKKIRSKLGQKAGEGNCKSEAKDAESSASAKPPPDAGSKPTAPKKSPEIKKAAGKEDKEDEEELNKKVAKMQVNDRKPEKEESGAPAAAAAANSEPSKVSK